MSLDYTILLFSKIFQFSRIITILLGIRFTIVKKCLKNMQCKLFVNLIGRYRLI